MRTESVAICASWQPYTTNKNCYFSKQPGEYSYVTLPSHANSKYM